MSYICSVFVGTGGSISLTGAATRIVLASLSGTTHSSKPANHTGICIPIIDRALQMIVMKRDMSHTQAQCGKHRTYGKRYELVTSVQLTLQK